MKLVIGKTYSCNVTTGKYTVVAVGTDGYYYASESRGWLAIPFDESGKGIRQWSHWQLSPIVVKKKGWIARFHRQMNIPYVSSIIFDTEAGVRAHFPNAASYHEIEWEEEE